MQEFDLDVNTNVLNEKVMFTSVMAMMTVFMNTNAKEHQDLNGKMIEGNIISVGKMIEGNIISVSS